MSSDVRKRISITPLLRPPARRAIASNLKPRDKHPEAAILFDLLLEFLEAVAHELGDLAATKASHVDVVASQTALVVVPLTVDVHQVEFVD
jgi:hypothetical protein